jgi:hypothetical protein
VSASATATTPTHSSNAFLADLRERIVNRPEISSDGFPAYPDAVDAATAEAMEQQAA